MDENKTTDFLSLNRWKSTGCAAQVVWGESTLTVFPALKEMVSLLQMEEKILEQPTGPPWKPTIRKQTKDLFQREILADCTTPGLQTFHGFVDDVTGWLTDHGVVYHMQDARLHSPSRRCSACMDFASVSASCWKLH